MNPFLKIIRKCLRVPMRLFEYTESERKREQCSASSSAVFHPPSTVSNFQKTPASIQVGDFTNVLGQLIVFPHGGIIKIGESCFIGENSRLWSGKEITIGNRVLISHDVNIHDSDSHSLSAAMRHQHFIDIFSTGHPEILEDVKSARIVIDDDAWIGYGSSILRGVQIGQGAVVGARSVVTKDVPAYAVVAGNPARVIGQARP